LAKLNVETVPAVSVMIEGVEYRKVERAAKAGDIVKMVATSADDDVTIGGFYYVDRVDSCGDAHITGDEGGDFDTVGDTLEVYEKVAEENAETAPRRLTVGDYAKVVSERASRSSSHRHEVGSVVKIVIDDKSALPYKCEKADGTRGCYIYEDEMEPATEAEFLAQKKPQDSSFKSGDVVRSKTGSPTWTTTLKERDPRMDGTEHGKAWMHTHDSGWIGENQFEKVTEEVPETTKPTEPAAIKTEPYVIHDGKVYVKETRTARVGEVITPLKRERYVTVGGTYEVTTRSPHHVHFTDDEGDRWHIADGDYAVLVPVPTEQRKAESGDRIVVISVHHEGIVVGETLTASSVDSEGIVITVKERNIPGFIFYNGSRVGKEYVVLGDTSKPARLTVGDYAKVVEDAAHYEIGEIIRITEDDGTRVPYMGERASDGTIGGYITQTKVVPATREEFEARRAEAAEPARLKVGDYARVAKAYGGHFAKVGDILKVWDIVTYGDNHIRCEKLDGSRKGNDYFYDDELVRATDEEIAAAKEAADPRNQFAVGDKVRLISGGRAHPLRGYQNGQMYTVEDPKFSGHRNERIKIVGGDQRTAFAKPEQLVKVSAEEIAAESAKAKWAAIGRKVNEYKTGDIVRITADRSAAGVVTGEIAEVKSSESGIVNEGVRLTKINPSGSNSWVAVSDVELVTPVEQRFDTPRSC